MSSVSIIIAITQQWIDITANPKKCYKHIWTQGPILREKNKIMLLSARIIIFFFTETKMNFVYCFWILFRCIWIYNLIGNSNIHIHFCVYIEVDYL